MTVLGGGAFSYERGTPLPLLLNHPLGSNCRLLFRFPELHRLGIQGYLAHKKQPPPIGPL